MFRNIHWFFTVFILFFCVSGCQHVSLKKGKIKQPFDTTILQESSKIGLFISGAGANTFSSISLLELFQKEKIQFNFIAGTGWGAWLAALYAKNHSVDELKWHLFKLKEQGVFGTRWFKNKKKRVKILKTLTTEVFSSPLRTPFVCPSLGKNGQLLWMTERRPAQAVFNCLNMVPPLFFLFSKTQGYGSLFSADLTLKYMKDRGINTIIWIRPSFSLKSTEQDITFSIFWNELIAYLNNIQNKYSHEQNQTTILKTKSSSFSLYDFSDLNAIMKSPVPLATREKIYRLKNKIKWPVYK